MPAALKRIRPRQEKEEASSSSPAYPVKKRDDMLGEEPREETEKLWGIPLRPTLTPIAEIDKRYPQGSAGWLSVRFGL